MSSTKHVSDHSNVHSRYFTSLQSLGHIFPEPMAVKTDLLGWFLIQSDLGGLSQTNKGEAKVFCLGLGIFTPESGYFLTQRAQERRAARWCYGRIHWCCKPFISMSQNEPFSFSSQYFQVNTLGKIFTIKEHAHFVLNWYLCDYFWEYFAFSSQKQD